MPQRPSGNQQKADQCKIERFSVELHGDSTTNKPHNRPCQHRQRPATLYGPSENTSAHHNTKDIQTRIKVQRKRFQIHICRKVLSDERMEPPIQTLYLGSGGAMTLIFMVGGARAVSSFVMHSGRSIFAGSAQ